jgi:hypothetical protein
VLLVLVDRRRGHVPSSFESEHQVEISSLDRRMRRQTLEHVVGFDDVAASRFLRINDNRAVAVMLFINGLTTLVTQDVVRDGRIFALAGGTPYHRFLLQFGVREG